MAKIHTAYLNLVKIWVAPMCRKFAQAKINLKFKVLEIGFVDKYLHLTVSTVATDELSLTA